MLQEKQRPDISTLKGRIEAYKNMRFETSEHSKAAHYLSLIPFELVRNFASRTIVEGTVPAEGAGLIVSNHAKGLDPFLVHYAVCLQGRSVRCMARETLINPKVKENEKAINRRTEIATDNKPYEKLTPIEKIVRELEAWYMKKFNPILVDIGGDNSRAFKETTDELLKKHLVQMFGQGTRMPACDLYDLLSGLTILLTRNLPRAGLEDTPIITMGISGSNNGILAPITIKFGKEFRVSDINIPKDSNLRESVAIVNNFVAQRLSEVIVDSSLKPAWELGELGLEEQEIRAIYNRGISNDPKWTEKFRRKEAHRQLVSAATLAKNFKQINPEATPEQIKNELIFIDQFAKF